MGSHTPPAINKEDGRTETPCHHYSLRHKTRKFDFNDLISTHLLQNN